MQKLYDPHMMLPSAHELLPSIPFIFGMLALRYVLSKYAFLPMGDLLIAPAKPLGTLEPNARLLRLERFGSCIFKFLYFTIMSVVGYALLDREDILPDCLRFFGTREAGPMSAVQSMFVDYPYHPLSSEMKLYFFIQLGYHGQSLLWTLSQPSRNDFAEMMLHHISTVILILCSYSLNFMRAGAQIMFVHDVADVFAYAIKASVDTPYTVCTLVLYASLLTVWGWTRLWVFPRYIISAVFEALVNVPEPLQFVLRFSGFLLSLLAILHYYWYALFIRMGYLFLSTGKTLDIQHRVEKIPTSDSEKETTSTLTSLGTDDDSSVRRRRPID